MLTPTGVLTLFDLPELSYAAFNSDQLQFPGARLRQEGFEE